MLNPPFSFADNRAAWEPGRNRRRDGGEKRRSGVSDSHAQCITSLPVSRRGALVESAKEWEGCVCVGRHTAHAHRIGGLALGKWEGDTSRRRASPIPGSLHSSRHIPLSSSSHDYDLHMCRALRVLSLLVLLAPLTACGLVNRTGNSDDPGADEWITRVDSETGITLRCLVIWRSSPHKGGPAMWCVER